MTIEPLLAELLACPACRGPLREEGGALRCPACAKAYPVVDGIPDFLA